MLFFEITTLQISGTNLKLSTLTVDSHAPKMSKDENLIWWN